MTSYLVRLIGRNALVYGDDGPKKLRFTVIRLVEAGDRESAQALAVERTQEAIRLEVEVRNDPSDPPGFEIEWVDEVGTSAFDAQRRSATIYWHEEDPEA